MLLTPSEISAYCVINGTPTQLQIDSVVRNINAITNNFFVSDLCISTDADFAGGSGGTITIGSNWEDFGFANSDEIFVSGSYRNDGYKTVSTVTTSVMTLVTTSTAIAELSGRTIYFSVVQWPEGLKQIAAQMVAFDVDIRPNQDANVKSITLGPWSETRETGGEQSHNYPQSMVNALSVFRLASIR